MSDLPRTPVHAFGESLSAHRRHAADFEACPSWPHCGCIRHCATAEQSPPASGFAFWLALALSTVVPVAFGALLVSFHVFPGFWSFLP